MKNKNYLLIIGMFFSISNANLFAQNIINVSLNFDSISTTIFNQDNIRVIIDFADSVEINFYSRQSGVEIDMGNGKWSFCKDPVQPSEYQAENIRNNIFGEINLLNTFCRDTLLFNSFKSIGGEISLRYRLYCSIDSSSFEYRYSNVKKILLPPATSDDVNALLYLTTNNVECDDFSWLYDLPEETELVLNFIKDNYPNSVVSDIAKYQSIKIKLSRSYHENNTYTSEMITEAKNVFDILSNSKSKYLSFNAAHDYKYYFGN